MHCKVKVSEGVRERGGLLGSLVIVHTIPRV